MVETFTESDRVGCLLARLTSQQHAIVYLRDGIRQGPGGCDVHRIRLGPHVCCQASCTKKSSRGPARDGSVSLPVFPARLRPSVVQREKVSRSRIESLGFSMRQQRHSKEGGNHLEQESNRQKTMEGIDGGLHPAVDGQSPGER